MENIQQKTDYQILRQYISNYPGASTYFTPDLMIRDALRYMNHIRSLHELILPTQQFQLLYEYTRHVTSPVIVEEPTIDLFCITLYILLRADGVETQNEKDLILAIEEKVADSEDAYWDKENIEEVIRQIQEFRKIAPKFYQPLDEFREIVEGKNLKTVDWPRLLREMIHFSRETNLIYPHFIVLHTFLIFIHDITRRLDVLFKLRDAAPLVFEKNEAKKFHEEASWLVSVYQRLRVLMINNPLPKVWEYDEDFNELVLWMNDITPEEMVALAQVHYDSRKYQKRYGVIAHVLQIPKYMNKIIIDSGLEFCRCLYLANGSRQYIQSGVGEEFQEMPTLDTQSIIFMNKCYEIFLKHRIGCLRDAYIKEHQIDKSLSYYLHEIFNELDSEFYKCFVEEELKMDNPKAFQSLKARFEDLKEYTFSVMRIEEDREPHPHNEKFQYIISDDDNEILKVHKRIEMFLISPAKLRDELLRLQSEGLVSLPMDNPTAIIREVKRIWSDKAPKERSFVTTWSRLKC